MAREFLKGKEVLVTCSAFLYAPGKVVVGIVQLDQQEVVDKVPHVSLL